MNTTYSFSELNSALSACTSYYLTRETTEEGEQGYALRDGCRDQDGDLFETLEDVQDLVTSNQDCFDYLYKFSAVK